MGFGRGVIELITGDKEACSLLEISVCSQFFILVALVVLTRKRHARKERFGVSKESSVNIDSSDIAFKQFLCKGREERYLFLQSFSSRNAVSRDQYEFSRSRSRRFIDGSFQ